MLRTAPLVLNPLTHSKYRRHLNNGLYGTSLCSLCEPALRVKTAQPSIIRIFTPYFALISVASNYNDHLKTIKQSNGEAMQENLGDFHCFTYHLDNMVRCRWVQFDEARSRSTAHTIQPIDEEIDKRADQHQTIMLGVTC